MRANTWKTSLILALSAVPAWAGAGKEEGGGLLTIAFLAFFTLIVVAQLIPGIVLFVSMVKGLFSGRSQPAPAKAVAPERTGG